MFQGSVANEEHPITIPVASISQQDGIWLEKKIQQEKKTLNIETAYQETKTDIASFSSRGPVTVNWDIKPDVVAPGANILSTVPGGYQELQGTSMAAPHVTGAIALLKEAKPDWSNEQMIGALKTTAKPIRNEEDQSYDPVMQGTGKIQIEDAINTKTIIHDPLLSFGKIDPYKETNNIKKKIQQMSNKHILMIFLKRKKGWYGNYRKLLQ